MISNKSSYNVKLATSILNLGFGTSILLFGSRTPTLVILIAALQVDFFIFLLIDFFQ
jgi:hypothetical protein